MSTRGGTTTMIRPRQPVTQEPRPRQPVKQEPRGSFDLGAWVHGLVGRADETPSEPFKQGVVRAERPSAAAPQPQPQAKPTRAPERSLDGQGLARWAFGLVQKDEDAPRRAPSPRPSSARRKALTMPDLFEGGAVPPCLRDD